VQEAFDELTGDAAGEAVFVWSDAVGRPGARQFALLLRSAIQF